MKLHILGTGHADVLKNYNNCFIIENNGKKMLIDAGGGNGVLSQMSKLNISAKNLDCAFISHNHSDHLLGFVWILRWGILYPMLYKEEKAPFVLYGNKNCLQAIDFMGKATCGEKHWDKLKENRLVLKEVKDGQKEKIIGLDFEFFDTLASDMPQMAFYIKDKDFVFCGDVPLDEQYFDRFKNKNYLCLEAFCTEKDRIKNALPLSKHKTAAECAQLAETLKAKNIILWHCEDDVDGTRKQRYIKEAQQFFNGNIIVPNDLETIEIQ